MLMTDREIANEIQEEIIKTPKFNMIIKYAKKDLEKRLQEI